MTFDLRLEMKTVVRVQFLDQILEYKIEYKVVLLIDNLYFGSKEKRFDFIDLDL